LKWNESSSNIFSLEDIRTQVVRRPPYLFGDFLLDRSLTAIVAPPFTGKSLMLAAMAIALDAQVPLFGTYMPGDMKRCLCILQDAPTWDYAEQFNKLMRGYQLDKEASQLLDAQLIINRAVQVTEPKFREHMSRVHEDFEFDILFLDAFWTLHSFNENDNSQMGYVMSQLKWVRDEFRAAVIFTHHERKFSQLDGPSNATYRSRGSTVIPAACDAILNLSRHKNRITLDPVKARGDESPRINFDIVDVNHPEGAALRLNHIDETDREGKLMMLLASGPKPRKEIVAFYEHTYGITTVKAYQASNNDINSLYHKQKIKSLSRGIWTIA
jgi:hypothetical protein